MRTFLAVPICLSNNTLAAVKNVSCKLNDEPIKWVDFSSLHLTLFFLGKTSVEMADEVSEFLKDELSECPSFDINLRGLGTFGSFNNPKVLWIGIEPNHYLTSMQERVEQFLVSKGYPSDTRGFNPHITIGRIKSTERPKLIDEVIAEIGSRVAQVNPITRIILYKSDLTTNGPVYTEYYSQGLKE